MAIGVVQVQQGEQASGHMARLCFSFRGKLSSPSKTSLPVACQIVKSLNINKLSIYLHIILFLDENEKGKAKFFNEMKGFGFIKNDDSHNDFLFMQPALATS